MSAKRDLRTHRILQEIHQRICVDHCTDGKVVKEGYKVSVERRVSTQSGYLEGKDGYRVDISISRLGEDIPRACRCINDSTWSYLGAARSGRLGSPDNIFEHKVIILRIEL
jgi:hypothetical protein